MSSTYFSGLARAGWEHITPWPCCLFCFTFPGYSEIPIYIKSLGFDRNNFLKHRFYLLNTVRAYSNESNVKLRVWVIFHIFNRTFCHSDISIDDFVRPCICIVRKASMVMWSSSGYILHTCPVKTSALVLVHWQISFNTFKFNDMWLSGQPCKKERKNKKKTCSQPFVRAFMFCVCLANLGPKFCKFLIVDYFSGFGCCGFANSYTTHFTKFIQRRGNITYAFLLPFSIFRYIFFGIMPEWNAISLSLSLS